MSATPNNAAPAWGNARTLTPAVAQAKPEADGHNALQGLLAFACVHQQAARRKREIQNSADPSLRFSREEELALDEILQLVAVRAIAITGADGIAIALAKDRAIVCRASAGRIAPDPGVKLDPSSGFSGACLRSGEIIRCDDSDHDSRVNPEACRALGARSMIAVPLSAKKRVIGLLEAFSAETHGFNDSDVRSLNLLGELILAAIRPEEEHHLAEMAREILPEAAGKPESAASSAAQVSPAATFPAPATASEAVVSTATLAAPSAAPVVPPTISPGLTQPLPVIPPKVLIDEKFAPVSASARAAFPSKAPVEEPAEKVASPIASDSREKAGMAPAETIPAAFTVVSPVAAESVELGRDLEQTEGPVEKKSFLSLTLTAAGIMVAIAMAAILFWKAQHLSQPISADTRGGSEATVSDVHPGDSRITEPAPPLKIGALAQVLAIHHSSTSEMSTVVVDLEDQVQYEAHSLDDPPRIYFDLHDTKLSPGATSQLNVDDAFLKRIRVAQPVEGITRVVLETKNQPDFSVSLDNNPYRLTIQVHRPGIAPGNSVPAIQPQAVQPKPSPAVNPAPAKPSASGAQATAGNLEIVLDAGHGGWDLGTVGKKGLLEKDLVLDIVQRLGTLLQTKLGASVIYTRQDDSYVSLEKRAEIANLSHADLFLSIHANYSDLSTARGVETYYTNTYSSVKARTPEASLQQVNWSGVVDIRAKVKGAKLLASDIQQSLYGGQATRNPEIRNRGVKEAQYVVLTGTQMPAVLAEVSFVSSPADENRLQSSEYRQLIAEALYQGIAKYRQESQRTKLASAGKISQ